MNTLVWLQAWCIGLALFVGLAIQEWGSFGAFVWVGEAGLALGMVIFNSLCLAQRIATRT